MKSIKALFLTALAILAVTATANADPLPNGTLLPITRGVGGAPNTVCAGSCFGMEVAPGFVVWTDFGPGTDGGFIVGKAQKSGGQEIGPSSANITPGELTAYWLFAGNAGTFSTDPGGEQNIFSDTSCAGAACIGHTELKYFHIAWNGGKAPLGSANGCTHANCTPEQLAGIFIREWTYNAQDGTYTLDYSNVVSSGSIMFIGVKFRVRLVKKSAPVATDVSLQAAVGSTTLWQPSVSDTFGGLLTCSIVTPPSHGVASVSPDCSSGSYSPTTPGYLGPDSFTYKAKYGVLESNIATVSVTIQSGGPSTGSRLPINTKLGMTQGVGSAPNLSCSIGSCFGMEVAPGFTVWTDFGPGVDGGFIVGKAQKCGSQELGPSDSNTTPGDLTAAWLFFGNFGTFCTDPGGEMNLFDTMNCAGGSCIGKTELKFFYAAWDGTKIPLGSSNACVHPNCSPEQKAGVFISNYQVNPFTGGTWSMNFSQVVPSGQFAGVRFSLITRGLVELGVPCNCPPTAGNVSLTTGVNILSTWKPVVTDYDGNPIFCRIGTPPLNGIATVKSDCSSGTYQSNPGFIGLDTFTYIPNNTIVDGAPGVVTVAVAELTPTPTPTATFTPTVIPSLTTSPTYTPTFTATATPTPMGCTDKYPVTQFTQTGREGTLKIAFTGNITSHTNKEVKVCPGTSLDYTASSTKDMVKCKVRNTTTGSGTLRIQDNLKCTDKPKGKDKVHFKVKSGVTK